MKQWPRVHTTAKELRCSLVSAVREGNGDAHALKLAEDLAIYLNKCNRERWGNGFRGDGDAVYNLKCFLTVLAATGQLSEDRAAYVSVFALNQCTFEANTRKYHIYWNGVNLIKEFIQNLGYKDQFSCRIRDEHVCEPKESMPKQVITLDELRCVARFNAEDIPIALAMYDSAGGNRDYLRVLVEAYNNKPVCKSRRI